MPKGATTYECVKANTADGAACVDQDACTVGAICKAGTCSGASKQKFFSRTLLPPLSQGAFNGVAATDDGGFVAVGQTWSGDAAQPQATAWWIARTDGAGDAVWPAAQVTAAAAHMAHAAHDVQFVGGTVYVCGAMVAAGQGLNAAIVRLTDQGKLQWSKQLGGAGGDEAALAMLADPLGNSTLVGWREAAGQRRAWATRIGANEEAVWTLEHGAKGDTVQAQAVAAAADGGVVVAARIAHADQKRRGLLLAITAQGALLWQTEVGGDVYRLADMALVGGKTAVLAGWRDPTSTAQPWLAGSTLPAKGGLLWQHQPPASGIFNAVVAHESGRLLLAGRTTPLGGDPSAWLLGTDRLGNTRWSRTLSLGEATEAADLVALGDDGVVTAGRALMAGKSRGMLARVDPWGHITCADAGVCVKVKDGACDDKDPCTTDVCDPKTGCKNGAVDNLLCDAADGCSNMSACSQGKCPPTAEGRLFSRTWDLGGKATLSRAVLMPDGGYALVGQAKPPAEHGMLVSRVAADGSLIWQDKYSDGKAATVGLALQPTADGGLIAIFMSNNTGMRRYDPNGKALWKHGYDWFEGHRLHDLLRLTDGGHILVLQVNYSSKKWVRLRKINDSGTTLWSSPTMITGYMGQTEMNVIASTKSTQTGTGIFAVRAAAADDGSIYLGGTLRPKLNSYVYNQAWLGRASATGTPLWNQGYDGGKTAPDEYLFDVATVPGGGALAVGERRWDAVKYHGYLLRVDADGKKLWERFDSTGGSYSYGAIARVSADSFVVGGTAGLVGYRHAWAMAIDGKGQQAWNRAYAGSGWISSVTALGNGDLLLGGSRLGGSAAALLMRTDRWGHPGCAAAGPCLIKKAKDCDDSDPCTVDACSADGGCTHSKLAACDS